MNISLNWLRDFVDCTGSPSELDDLLSQREKINLRLQQIIDSHTGPWGIKVSNVEVKQIDLPQEMQRAIAKLADDLTAE
jgi:regulator of protease activity HflC (stomatin/prohibitin superfamily)